VLDFLPIGKFAKRTGRSVSTVRQWEAEGRITARRTSTGQRYFDDSDVHRVLRPGFDEAARRTVVCCRVSSPGQKDDLASQVAADQESLSARRELVEDLLAIVHTFSGRLSGLRRYEKAVKDELAGGGS